MPTEPTHLAGRQRLAALVLAACCSLVAQLAAANTLLEERKLPIQIEADSAEQDDRKGITIYRGNVTIAQGSLTINAQEVTIESLPATETQRRQIGSIVATGAPAEFIQRLPDAQVTASGGIIEYGIEDGVILLRENASIDSPGNRVSGNLIEYHLNDELIKAKANPNNANERVHTVFDPGERLVPEPEPSPEGDETGLR